MYKLTHNQQPKKQKEIKAIYKLFHTKIWYISNKNTWRVNWFLSSVVLF